MANNPTPFDRNQRAREENQAARVRHARQEFAQMVAQGHAWVNDRFGNPIRQGQMVLHVATPVGLVCQVMEITPNLNPAAQVGQMIVKVMCEIPLTYAAGQNALNLLVLSPPAAGGAGALAVAEAPAGGDQVDQVDQEPAVSDRGDDVASDALPEAPLGGIVPSTDEPPAGTEKG